MCLLAASTERDQAHRVRGSRSQLAEDRDTGCDPGNSLRSAERSMPAAAFGGRSALWRSTYSRRSCMHAACSGCQPLQTTAVRRQKIDLSCACSNACLAPGRQSYREMSQQLLCSAVSCHTLTCCHGLQSYIRSSSRSSNDQGARFFLKAHEKACLVDHFPPVHVCFFLRHRLRKVIVVLHGCGLILTCTTNTRSLLHALGLWC